MKIVVTHQSPDLDAIVSVWLLKRFLADWQEAKIEFVPAGSKLPGNYKSTGDAIEILENNEVIHVDTGLGKLDHHQIQDNSVCAASLTYEYVKGTERNGITTNEIKQEAIEKIVNLTIDEDHFQEVYYEKCVQEMYDFSFAKLIDGYKLQNPQDSEGCMEFGMKSLDILLQFLENKAWAISEIQEKSVEFETRYGKGLGIETINDAVLEVAQGMGYEITVRRDPNHGFIRIKARPKRRQSSEFIVQGAEKKDTVDLTGVFEELRKMDPDASWYLHVSKKMLLNGSSKNPNVTSSKLSLSEVIKVLKKI